MWKKIEKKADSKKLNIPDYDNGVFGPCMSLGGF